MKCEECDKEAEYEIVDLKKLELNVFFLCKKCLKQKINLKK